MAKPNKTNLSKQPAQSPKPSPHHPNNNIVSAQWSGPLPPPGALAQFNDIIPNGAERIMAMVEQEQQHRIQYDQLGINATIKDKRRGQWLGGLISLLAVGGSIYTAYIDAPAAVSIALVSVPILGIVRAFVTGSD